MQDIRRLELTEDRLQTIQLTKTSDFITSDFTTTDSFSVNWTLASFLLRGREGKGKLTFKKILLSILHNNCNIKV